MAIINIYDSSFYDHASVIKNLQESSTSVDYDRIIQELRTIKATLQTSSPEYRAVEALEQSSKTERWERISSTVRDLSVQFSSAALANLAGAYLSRLLGL